MKKIVSMTLLVFLSASICFARGGDETHNGGGLAEQNMIFAWMGLRETVALSQQWHSAQDPQAALLLQTVASSVSQEFRDGQLQFFDYGDRADLFPQGVHQVWSTAPKVGAPVDVNTAALYEAGIPRSVDHNLPLLISAVFSHFPQYSMSTKVSATQTLLTLSSRKFSEISLTSLNQPSLRILLWNLSPRSSVLQIADSRGAIDLTALVLEKLKCLDSISGQNSMAHIAAFTISSPTWQAFMPPWDTAAGRQPIEVNADIQYTCKLNSTQTVINATLQIVFDAEVWIDGQAVTDPECSSRMNALLMFDPNYASIILSHRKIESSPNRGGSY